MADAQCPAHLPFLATYASTWDERGHQSEGSTLSLQLSGEALTGRSQSASLPWESCSGEAEPSQHPCPADPQELGLHRATTARGWGAAGSQAGSTTPSAMLGTAPAGPGLPVALGTRSCECSSSSRFTDPGLGQAGSPASSHCPCSPAGEGKGSSPWHWGRMGVLVSWRALCSTGHSMV